MMIDIWIYRSQQQIKATETIQGAFRTVRDRTPETGFSMQGFHVQGCCNNLAMATALRSLARQYETGELDMGGKTVIEFEHGKG